MSLSVGELLHRCDDGNLEGPMRNNNEKAILVELRSNSGALLKA